MIVNERIVSYIHSLEKSNGPLLDEMEAYAKENRVPIIRKEVESFLRVLLEMQHPTHILELGNYEKRIPIARENIKNAGMEDKITVVQGDALEEMKKMPDASVDFIFMDAAKAQYVHYLKEAVRLMKKGAVLVTDNVFQEGDLIESRYIVTRRDRTIHSRMREYLKMIKEEEQLVTTIVPMGDGLTVSVKER